MTGKGKISGIIAVCCAIVAFLMIDARLIAADAKPADSRGPGHPTRVALFYSNPGQTEDDAKCYSMGMFDLLMVKLMHKPNIELIERAMIDAILDEYGLTLRQSLAPEEAIRFGRMAGAEVTIVGMSVEKSGKKALWVKVIDNTSGIIKDVAYFFCQDHFAGTLESLVEFAWAASIADITIEQRKIVAIGGFEDQSINDRQMGRSDEIRRFLELKYIRKPGICLVERSQMKPLLLELNLERMGITGAGNGSITARPAFTIVSGNYHLIRKSETIYVVNLRLDFLGKTSERIKVQGPSWNNVLKKIGEKMDGMLASVD